MKRQFAIGCLSMIAVSCTLLAQNKKTTVALAPANVRIVPVTVYGSELHSSVSVEQFTSLTNGKNFANHFHAGQGTDIPYDVYRARMFVGGAYTTYRDIRVFEPETLAVIAFAAGVEGGAESQTSAVSGTIETKGAAENWPLRIRLSGVYSGTIIDAVVNNSQEFSILSVPNGTYLLSVTVAEKVLYLNTVRVPSQQSTRFIINVGDRTP